MSTNEERLAPFRALSEAIAATELSGEGVLEAHVQDAVLLRRADVETHDAFVDALLEHGPQASCVGGTLVFSLDELLVHATAIARTEPPSHRSAYRRARALLRDYGALAAEAAPFDELGVERGSRPSVEIH
ncbi:MAG: hypothetical protein U0230_17290 [Polyangiales bacterium]